MTFDPKLTMWFNVVLAVILWLATGSVQFPDFVSSATAHHITTACAFLGALLTTINVALSGYSSAKKGPLVPPTSVEKIMPCLMWLTCAAILCLMLASGTSAEAKTPLPPKRPVAAVSLPSIDTIIKDLQSISLADLQAADADAKATGDKTASTCYEGIITLVQAQQAALGAQASLPKVHIFTTFQQGRDLVVSMRAGSPIRTACAPLAEEIKSDVLTVISQIAAGSITAGTFLAPLGL